MKKTSLVCIYFFYINLPIYCFAIYNESPAAASRNMMQQSHLDSLPRIAPILGESAIVDKESGRVFWQGGRQSLFESTVGHSYLSNHYGVLRHVRATLFTCILWTSLVRFVADLSLRQKILQKFTEKLIHPSQKVLEVVKWLTRAMLFCLACLPKWPREFLLLIAVLYLLESYTCSTRRYLANSYSCPDEIETYMESIREEAPCVSWRIRCYHYEKRKWLCVLLMVDVWSYMNRSLQRWQAANNAEGMELRSSSQSLLDGNETMIEEGSAGPESGDDDAKSTTSAQNDDDVTSSISSAMPLGPSLLTRKVITHNLSENYKFEIWHDDTIGGIWKQAQAATSVTAAFTKIGLHKLLLFGNSNARVDYFQQQSRFVRREGGKDTYAEFSTHVDIPGYKQKLLAVRPTKGIQKLFNIYYFWLFTFLGLTVPYRIRFSNHCDELRVAVVKETAVKVKSEKDAKYADSSKKQSWFASPRSWFGAGQGEGGASVDVVQNMKERTEKFRKHMQEIALYQGNADEEDVGRETATETETETTNSIDEKEVESSGKSVENGGNEFVFEAAPIVNEDETSADAKIVSQEKEVSKDASEKNDKPSTSKTDVDML